MKRFFLLLALSAFGSWLHGQPGAYVWNGDNNWSTWDPTHHNSHANSSLGSPYSLAVDPSTPGSLKYSFTAGIGGGYRADQIVFWVNRTTYWGLVSFTDPVDGSPGGVEQSFSTPAARDAWIDAISALFVLYDPGASSWQTDWQVLGIGGSPHGVPSASEISNDSTQRGATYRDKILTYDSSEYGGTEVRASFWTFQRTAGNEQKLEMQDRGPWALPRGPVSINLSGESPAAPAASISPDTLIVTLGQTAILDLAATNAAPTGNKLVGEGAPSSVALLGSVYITPMTTGTKVYTYSVIGQASLSWKVDDPTAILTLNSPTERIDVTAPPRGRIVYLSGDYTLTATNSFGTATSPIVHVDIPTASATATITVNAAVSVSTGGTAAISVLPNARCWADSTVSPGYTAYLARHDVEMRATSVAEPSESIVSLELQAMGPKDADWQTLASRSPGNPTSADEIFDFSIDSARGGETDPKNLVPRDPSLAGTWHYRVLAHFQSGHVAYSSDLPLNVVLPIVTKTVEAETLPPAGPEGKWYTPSDLKNYTINLLVP